MRAPRVATWMASGSLWHRPKPMRGCTCPTNATIVCSGHSPTGDGGGLAVCAGLLLGLSVGSRLLGLTVRLLLRLAVCLLLGLLTVCARLLLGLAVLARGGRCGRSGGRSGAGSALGCCEL